MSGLLSLLLVFDKCWGVFRGLAFGDVVVVGVGHVGVLGLILAAYIFSVSCLMFWVKMFVLRRDTLHKMTVHAENLTIRT